jgi:hypothetical protein
LPSTFAKTHRPVPWSICGTNSPLARGLRMKGGHETTIPWPLRDILICGVQFCNSPKRGTICMTFSHPAQEIPTLRQLLDGIVPRQQIRATPVVINLTTYRDTCGVSH